MAFWIQILGKRKLDSLEKEQKRISKILDNMPIDLSFLSNSEFDSNYDAKKWKITKWKIFNLFEYPLNNKKTGSLDSILIFYGNADFIEFSGPFPFFAQTWYFVNEQHPEVTKGWRKIFTDFAKNYGLSELLYFPENFYPIEGIYSGEQSFNDLLKHFENNKDVQANNLFDLEKKCFFIDKI